MTVHFTLISSNRHLLSLVRDFAQGLGCSLSAEPASMEAVHVVMPDGGDPLLLHLLTHVALSAARCGVDAGEPLCQVQYSEGNAPAMRLAFRIAEFNITPDAGHR